LKAKTFWHPPKPALSRANYRQVNSNHSGILVSKSLNPYEYNNVSYFIWPQKLSFYIFRRIARKGKGGEGRENANIRRL